ncbi:hypothetical protein Q8F55_004690 [Vanrija albida]|uniref:N-acetyltransferase domain-containing protein n=1 Tax=Vanrija albida TaxID=181172 RepID=A0ABR3Q8B1_9TREE
MSTAPTITRVTDDSPATVEQYAKILSDAFGPGHVAQAMHGGNPEVVLARMRVRVYEGVKDLEVWSATAAGETEPGAVLIVAAPGIVWGETPNAENEYNEKSKVLLADKPKAAAASKRIGEGFHELEERAWGPETTKPFYYITYLATTPAAEGKGLGSALVAHITTRAKAEGEYAVLLTQNLENVEWYAKRGFRDVDQISFPVNDVPLTFWALSTEGV